jgi:hypothetical protein
LSIIIDGTLNGSGTTAIDLGIFGSGTTNPQIQTIADWEGKQILNPNGAQRARFTLGQLVTRGSSPSATAIPKTYKIATTGKLTK